MNGKKTKKAKAQKSFAERQGVAVKERNYGGQTIPKKGDKYWSPNDPKLEIYLRKVNDFLKEEKSMHRLNVVGTQEWAIKHLEKSLKDHKKQSKRHKNQAEILKIAIDRVRAYKDKKKKSKQEDIF